jgi:CheY-like chemotaxis protein
LIVDDDSEIRETLRWLLEDEGLASETATDGLDALECVARSWPALILLDMGLPILDGEGFAARLKSLYECPPPIVVISASGWAGQLAERIGAVGYLSKPFDLDELAQTVHSVIARTPAAR